MPSVNTRQPTALLLCILTLLAAVLVACDTSPATSPASTSSCLSAEEEEWAQRSRAAFSNVNADLQALTRLFAQLERDPSVIAEAGWRADVDLYLTSLDTAASLMLRVHAPTDRTRSVQETQNRAARDLERVVDNVGAGVRDVDVGLLARGVGNIEDFASRLSFAAAQTRGLCR